MSNGASTDSAQRPNGLNGASYESSSASQPQANGEDRLGPLVFERKASSRSSRPQSSARSLSSHSIAPTIHEGEKTPTGRTTPTQSNPGGQSQTATATASAANREGDGNSVAQLYAVFGLPKDPSVWTLAEEDCVAGVHHMEGAIGRFWRPEVLGCSICPPATDLLNGKSPATDAKKKSGGSTSTNPKFIEMADGRGRIEKAETAKVLSKALKLSFTREIEIVASQANAPPMASSHIFSFEMATQGETTRAGSRNESVPPSPATFNGSTGSYPSSSSRPNDATSMLSTFYGVALTVWSAADEKRTKAIKRELARAARARGSKSAEVEDSFLPANNAFFMPYAICIVSRYPLYDLLSDYNKWAWHKYSRNIEMHNKLMTSILSTMAPRVGERLVVQSSDGDIGFACTFPGALEWGTGQLGVNLSMWPLFKTLSVDNILTICEIALTSHGRVLFMSRHPALLGIAVETIKYLVELRGWRGVTNQNCHARDVKIYLEDPGTWLIAISTELRSIFKPPRDVCLVDLDIDFVNCPSPPAGAPSTRGLREKRRRKLLQALGFSTGDFRPPREIIEAYPGGRFRPLSTIISAGPHSPYDHIEPPIWWDQQRVITGFVKCLGDGSSRGNALTRLLRGNKDAQAQVMSPTEVAAIVALRQRASTFVDARDGLENKIGRLNKRLAFLMSEGDAWKSQFTKIQQLVDRLTKEANETRAKLDKERRESRRLSSTLAQRDMERAQLQLQLQDTETAREEAKVELFAMKSAMDSLETEREAMMGEIRNIISGAEGQGLDDAQFDTSRFALYNESSMGHGSSNSVNDRVTSPAASQESSSTPSQAAERILKYRKAAEDRINEGRPSSRAGDSTASHSGIKSPRTKTTPTVAASSLGGNHFPDEQMNYEISQRTASVTDQIAKIQAQLENTLSGLERRGGSSGQRRRHRGDSAASSTLSHTTGLGGYEMRAPSSLGGGHTGTASDTDGGRGSGGVRSSTRGLTTDSEVNTDSEYHGSEAAAASSRRREARRAARAASAASNGGEADSSSRKKAAAPPSAYRGPSAWGGEASPTTTTTSPGPATPVTAKPSTAPLSPSTPSFATTPSRAKSPAPLLNGNGATPVRSSSPQVPSALSRGVSSSGMVRSTSKPAEREQINPWKVATPVASQPRTTKDSTSSSTTATTADGDATFASSVDTTSNGGAGTTTTGASTDSAMGTSVGDKTRESSAEYKPVDGVNGEEAA